MSDLIIVGDEAYTPAEWAKRERIRERERAYGAKNRDRLREYQREWRARPENIHRKRKYNREWMRRKRAALGVVGYLHELCCDGQHWRARKRCRPIPVFTQRAEAA